MKDFLPRLKQLKAQQARCNLIEELLIALAVSLPAIALLIAFVIYG